MQDWKEMILPALCSAFRVVYPLHEGEMFAAKAGRELICYGKAVGVQDETICSLGVDFGKPVERIELHIEDCIASGKPNRKWGLYRVL
jgi:hypothetical protein